MAAASTLKSRAYRYLRQQIILGQFPPGTRVTEESLSRQMGISRGPIREALRQLDSEGIIRHVAHQGATVHAPSPHEFEELADLRASLESMIAARAAERITPRQVEQLRAQVAHMREIGRQVQGQQLELLDEGIACEVTRADLRFHGILMDAANCPRSVKILRDSRVLSFVWAMGRPDAVWGAVKHLAVTLREHHRIYKAVAARDPAAAREAMLRHLENSKDFFLSILETPSDTRAGSFGDFPSVRKLLASFEEGGEPLGEIQP